MSSDLYAFEAPFHIPSNPEFLSNGSQDLPFLSSAPCHLPLHQEEEECPSFFSFSPPSTFLRNLSLHHSKTILPDLTNPETEFRNSSVLRGNNVKCNIFPSSDYSHNQNLVCKSYRNGDSENVAEFIMQRSLSSKSFDGKPSFLFPNHLYETSFIQSHALSPPDHTFFAPQMRKVCSTGDLQNIQETQTSHTEETSFKVGRYSAQEKKEKISKYRAKRSQRNFNKTIKYTCRKTLADNRPRIRGRFARNDETIEIANPKATFSTRDEDEDVFWIEGLNEEVEDETVRAQQYVNSFGVYSGFQCYGL
ncbi:two-component response regulator-like APRR1 [Neltuma alba]|uniref:two-component response regulator-like APRR1 n=1 Tax=Neltuma alba TaxID=207710 RepID=UPI0010A3D612|nr:two-component response regulator-like APRR1 [Prosopis alba]